MEHLIDCYWPVIPYATLCAIYLLNNECSSYKTGSFRRYVLSLAPIIFLLLWVHTSKSYLEDLRDYTKSTSKKRFLNTNIKEHHNIFYVLLLIAIARAVTLVKVLLLIELAWICFIGMLIKLQFNHLQSLHTTADGWLIGISVTMVCAIINLWVLLQRQEEMYRYEEEHGFQYQTMISGMLILGGLSILLGLNIIQLLSTPNKHTFLNEVFGLFLYASTVGHMIIKQCCIGLVTCIHAICFSLSHFAYVLLVMLVVCK